MTELTYGCPYDVPSDLPDYPIGSLPSDTAAYSGSTLEALEHYYSLQQSFSGWINWDAQSATAALAGAVVSGVITAAVSYWIYGKGAEKERVKVGEEKRQATVNGATSAYFKIIELLDQGMKAGSVFVDPLNSANPMAWPVSPSGKILPATNTLPAASLRY